VIYLPVVDLFTLGGMFHVKHYLAVSYWRRIDGCVDGGLLFLLSQSCLPKTVSHGTLQD
jgi:hypothetical protein